MYLMDSIAATTAMIGNMRDPTLRIFSDMTERMRLAPRYLLDSSVMRASVELGLGRPKIFRDAMRHVRIPYPRMWVEWEESGRDRLRRELDEEENALQALKPVPDRLGFLLESDEGGRSGNVTWAWASAPNTPPNISPFDARFNLDAGFEQPTVYTEGLLRSKLAKRWIDNPVQLNALLDIWRTSSHKLSAWGRTWVEAGGTQERFFLSDIYGEFIEIWCIMLLLTSSRPTLAYRSISREKLNRARVRKREPSLLDHTQITMQLSAREIAGKRQPLGHARKSPRIHMVSRYLATRGDKHWLVEPYLRGQGEAVERHVRVTG